MDLTVLGEKEILYHTPEHLGRATYHRRNDPLSVLRGSFGNATAGALLSPCQLCAQTISIAASPSRSTVNTPRWPQEIDNVGIRLPVMITIPAFKSWPRSAK